MKIQSYSLQGRRSSNEDQHIHIININNQNQNINPINFIGVFDGHGGKTVSKYLKKNLPKYFLSKFDKDIYGHSKRATKYFSLIFNKIEQKLEQDHPRACKYCGSTALCAINYIHNGIPMLWIVNVGDSRGILCKKNNKVIQLSEDHKPNSTQERNRIRKLGGKIYYDGYDWRIKDLSLSRAVGDVEAKPYVTHLPQIYRYKLSKKDKFAIFACDGLWDVMSNKKAAEFVLNQQNKNYKGNIAKSLAEHAIKIGSYDNVSVVILFF
jgi:protein phosphatase 1L